jgi:Tol biopolymer transport system component
VFVVNPDGSGLSQVPNTGPGDSAPDWSPGGTELAFISAKSIWAINVDGSNRRRLIEGSAPSTLGVEWSPDGNRIVFSSIPPMSIEGLQDVYIFELSTGQLTKLTASENNVQPTWSPSGTKIAFISSRDGNSEMYVMNADGSGQIRLTDSPTADTMPSWTSVVR